MSNLCEPVLGANALFDKRESYRTIPNYLEQALSVVVYSLFIETLEKGSLYHLQSGITTHTPRLRRLVTNNPVFSAYYIVRWRWEWDQRLQSHRRYHICNT
jgi:hypothetical protein